jgi:hypothetical protein
MRDLRAFRYMAYLFLAMIFVARPSYVQSAPDADESGLSKADQIPCLEWTGVPFEKDGMVMVPVRDVLGWFGAQVEVNSDTRECHVFHPIGRLDLTLRDGAGSVTVNGKQIGLPIAITFRNDRSFIPLEWVAATFGAEVDKTRVPGSLVISTAAGKRLLPLSILPFREAGLICWYEKLRGSSPGAQEIVSRVRTALKRKLAAQGIRAIEVPTLARSLGKGFQATIVAHYWEEPGSSYGPGPVFATPWRPVSGPSGVQGTTVHLEITCMDDRGHQVGQLESVVGTSPSMLSFLVTDNRPPTERVVREVAREHAVENFFFQLDSWEMAPPVEECWMRECRELFTPSR